MTEARRDAAEAGAPPDRVAAGQDGASVVALIWKRPSTEAGRAVAAAGLSAAEAELLGEYNLYNG